jgi:hypothetical protein
LAEWFNQRQSNGILSVTIHNSVPFIMQVAGSLLLAFAWLKGTENLPLMKSRIDIRFGAAMAVALISSLTTIVGTSIEGLVSGLLCDALLFWAFKRTTGKFKINKGESGVHL